MQKTLILSLLLIGQTLLTAQMVINDNRIYGGNSVDEPRKFALAANNSVHFFGGRSFSNDGDLPGNNGGMDFWIMKRGASGSPVWSRNYGGNTNDELATVLPHPDGGAIGFGTTRSSQGIFGTLTGISGAWLMRTNASGNLIDGQIFGGTTTELAADAFRHISGNITLAIEANSPVVDGQISQGGTDTWIVHVSPSFQLQWSRRLGGGQADVPQAIDADVSGNIYIGANSRSNLSGLPANHGEEDAWLVKLGPNGTTLWEVSLGGSDAEKVSDIRYHRSGIVFVVLQSQSADGDFDENRGVNDLWLVRLNAATGAVLGKTPFGGSGNDFDGHIDFLKDDQLVLAATTTSSDGDMTGNKGLSDLWIARLDLNGHILQQMNYGGSVNDMVADVIVQDSLIHIISSSTSSDKNVPPNALAQADLWYLALNTRPDSCSDQFVCLPDSSLANELYPPAEDVLLCVNGCNAGYGPGPQVSGNSCATFDASTAYFKVTTDTTADLLTLSVASFEFNQPRLALFQAVNCGNFQYVTCAVGTGGQVQLSYVEVEPLTTYVVAISDAEGNAGDFELCASSVDVEFCNRSDRLYATSTSKGSPLNGPFQPGEEVQFCYELNTWAKLECNGFQGLLPTFGPGWDSTWFNPAGQPLYMDSLLMPVINHGFWAWYGVGEVRYNITNPINGYAGGQGLPPGWYFTNTADPPPTENPDQTTGDIYTCLPTIDSWKVCFTLKVVDDCQSNLDCSISMKTFSDGEIGSRNNLACVYDQAEVFNAYLRCCLNPNIENIQDFSICSGDTLLLLPETNLPEPVRYFWRADADPFIEGATNGNNLPVFQQILTTEAVIPLGVDYELWAESNGCQTDTADFRVTVLAPPTAQISSTGAISVCAGNTVTLNFKCQGTPPFVIDVYRDNAPFIQVLSEAGQTAVQVDPGFSSRLRIGGIRDASCPGVGTGFVDVTVRQESVNQFDTLLCEGGTLYVGDSLLTQPGTYTIRLAGGAENNCDSIVMVTVDIFPSKTDSIHEVICRGDTIYVLGTPYAETTDELIEYLGPQGCPNYIQLDLVVKDTFRFEDNRAICFGDTLLYRGEKLYAAGAYSFVEEVRPMCFEETILHLSLFPEIYVNEFSILADNGNGNGALFIEVKGGTGSLSFQWSNGASTESLFTIEAGTYTLTVTDELGCDATFSFDVPLVNATSDPYPLVGLRIRPTIVPIDGQITLENLASKSLRIERYRWWTANGVAADELMRQSAIQGQIVNLRVPDVLPPGIVVIQIILDDGRSWSSRLVKP